MLGGSVRVPAFLSECSGSSSVAICIMALAVGVVVSVWVLQLLMWVADVDGRGMVASTGDWGVVLGATGAGLGLFFIWVAISLVLGVVCILKLAVVAAVWASMLTVVAALVWASASSSKVAPQDSALAWATTERQSPAPCPSMSHFHHSLSFPCVTVHCSSIYLLTTMWGMDSILAQNPAILIVFWHGLCALPKGI